MVLVGLAVVPYLGIWLYAVTLLSSLSLPLVVILCGIGIGALFLAHRAALRAGIAESTLLKGARVAGIAAAALAGVAITTFIVILARSGTFSRSVTFDEPSVQVPPTSSTLTSSKASKRT
jgi:hypothetical protein